MWSIYFGNVIDIAESPKTAKKFVDSAILKTFFSLDVFLGAVLTFMFVGVLTMPMISCLTLPSIMRYWG